MAMNIYSELSEITHAADHGGTRTKESKSIETIDNDMSGVGSLAFGAFGIMCELAASQAGAEHGRTVYTASVETVDPDREALWIAIDECH